MKKYIIYLEVVLTFSCMFGCKNDSSESYLLSPKSNNIVWLYPNGEIQHIIPRESNSGFGYMFDSTGSLIEKAEFISGKRNGKFLSYYEDGSIKARGEYVDGITNGLLVSYFKNGAISNYSFYDSGTIIYYKSLSSTGAPYEHVLPISLTMKDDGFLEILLDYTVYDSTRIGVIIGNLNDKNELIDSLVTLGSDGLLVKYRIENKIKSVTGILYEIKMPEQDIMGEYYFKFSMEN